MTLWLRDLMDRYDQLSLRERIILLIAALLLIALIWDSIFMNPLDRERKNRLQQVDALRAEVSGLEKSIETMVAQGADDPDKERRQQVGKLQAEIKTLDHGLEGATAGLIAPKEMTQVLEQVLRKARRLTLHTLRSLPPEGVKVPGRDVGASASSQTPISVYRHGVELELTGSYLDTLYFLENLEDLPWHFFWDRIEFVTEQPSQGRVKLRLYTLGLEQDWIGV